MSHLKLAGLTRQLSPPCGLDLSSNDYLGLAEHPAIKKRMADAILRNGCGATGSRLLRGERESFSKIERRFARFKSAESALFFGSGYAANIGALTSFLDPGDVVFSDRLNHASLIDGIRLSRAERRVFRHADIEHLERLIKKESSPGQKYLVTESLFSMDGDFAPLREYADLCERTGTALVVDESHAVGIYGAHGSGQIEACSVESSVFLSINAAGKGLGVTGAFVAGPAWAIDYLVQRARTFVFSTAPPPAVADAIDEALNVIDTEPSRRDMLREKSLSLRTTLTDLGVVVPAGTSQILPIVIGDNESAVAVAAAIQDAGFDVRAIRPPTVPEGTARLRVSINIKIDDSALARFAEVLAKAVSRHGAALAAK
ncbi:MAG TPA: 8-amino-7-oxononanoate synthase [Blastocatellia bacterium]|nr:8-amino-7-oxononanoate synthase [Blastocatellia bacterium]